MAGLDTIRAIVEALRQDPVASGVTRDPGQIPRRIAGDMNPLKGIRDKTQYGRYTQIQNSAGESPVSYEEWIRSK